MKLSEWCAVKHSQTDEIEEVIDILAQLLAHICEGGTIRSADDFEIEKSDSSLMRLIFGGGKAEFDRELEPLGDICNDERDYVFAAGIILYWALAGKAPERSSMDRMKLVTARSGSSAPLLSIEGSSLNELVEGMSDVNCEKRLTAQKALDILAEKFPSSAVVRIVETETDAELERIDVPFTKGVIGWTPQKEYEYGENHFFTVDAQPMTLYYRMKNAQYTCYVSVQRASDDTLIDICSAQGKLSIGIDLGRRHLSVCALDSNGQISQLRLEGKSVIPAVLAYDENKKLAFAFEAQQLCENTQAEAIYCLDENMPCSVRAADGSEVQIKQDKMMELFFESVGRYIKELWNYSAQDTNIRIALSASCPLSKRTAVEAAAANAGMPVRLVSDICAMIISHLAECSMKARIGVMTVGCSTANAGAVSVGEGLCAQTAAELSAKWLDGTRASGGDAMTAVIYNSFLQTLNTRYNLKMFRQSDSGLDMTQFKANEALLRTKAEELKKKLSFSENAECEIELSVDRLTRKKVRLSIDRNRYENMIVHVNDSISSAIKQSLSNAGIDRTELDCFRVFGGAALTPSVMKAVRDVFKGCDCQIKMIYDTAYVSRGAAICEALVGNEEVPAVVETDKDIGVLKQEIMSNAPMFECLVPSGTVFENDSITFEYELTEFSSVKDATAELKLYSRKKGMSHVLSTFDPEGGKAIGYAGKLVVKLPEKTVLKNDEDKLVFRISMDKYDMISAEVFHIRKKGGLGRFLEKISNSAERNNNGRELKAEFVADKGKKAW